MRKLLIQTLKYFFIVLGIGITASVSAYGNNLWEHYDGQLPSLSERALVYEGMFDEEYRGSAGQNQTLHAYLDADENEWLGALAFPPSTVEGTSTAGWTDDGSNVRLNTAADFVGIGTANPSQKLSVSGGNVDISGDISRVTGDIRVYGDLFIGGADLNLGTGSATTTLTASGNNLGIGTTSPTDITPNASTTVAVGGSVFVAGTTTTQVLVASTTCFSGSSRCASWPVTNGTADQVLTTTGAGGVYYWNTPAGAVDAFELLVSTTTEANMVNATTTFAARNNLLVLIDHKGCSAACTLLMFFNTDATKANYADAIRSFNFPTVSPNNGTEAIRLNAGTATTSPIFFNLRINNTSAQRKYVFIEGVANSSAAFSPNKYEGVGVWNNTSAQITTLVYGNAASTETINSGTIIQVYGN